MQNGAESGFSEDHVNHQQQSELPPHINANTSSTPTSQSYPDIVSTLSTEPYLENPNQDSALASNGLGTPPAKRRKVTAPEIAKGQRPISPPWKKIEVEGPSTFLEGGVRKSARTNYVPIDLQPHSEKRKTRGAIHNGKGPLIKSKYGGATTVETPPAQHSQPLNGHRHPISTGKSSNGPTPKAARPKSTSSADLPPTQKRSHKKKIPQLPNSPTGSQSSIPSTATFSRPHPSLERPHRSRSTAASSQAPTTNGWHAHDEDSFEEEKEESVSLRSPDQKPQRLNLRFSMPKISVHHPEHVLRRQQTGDPPLNTNRFASFSDWLDKEGRLGLEGETDSQVTDEEAVREALLRHRISEAAKPNGLLSKERCTYWQPETSESPSRLYSHQDRLLAHMRNFHMLLGRERTRHLRAAKECAQQAAALVQSRQERSYQDWKKHQPKTEEEIRQEQEEAYKKVYVQLREDVARKWLMVAETVEDLRLQRWQLEQERLGKEALNEAIEKSKGLLSRRNRGNSAEGFDDEDEAADDDESGPSSSGEASEDEDNMSSSNSESEDGEEPMDEDEGLTQEQLHLKYKIVNDPDPQSQVAEWENGPVLREEDTGDDTAHVGVSPGSPTSPVALEEVDHTLMDDSDQSTKMSGESESSEEMSSEEDESGSAQSEAEGGLGDLGGFLSKQEREELLKAPMKGSDTIQEPSPYIEDSDEEADKVSLIPDTIQDPVQAPTPPISTGNEPPLQEQDDGSLSPEDLQPPEAEQSIPIEEAGPLIEEIDGQELEDTVMVDSKADEADIPTTPVATPKSLIPIPSLLRGTLREYQHFGLDWLAGLYANGTNGILADEMGLGKTIQTIALLAHLAVHHEAWGPHLIVVPTSVMLNWEMEFKKFLPGFRVLAYYGSQEERRKKRAGWLDEEKWNVWITSYTLVTQDQQIFRRRAWHYMILDEAHNIKNFQSQRWQTLLGFKTRARLLLTGTPLQNNLTELWSLLYFLMPSDNPGKGIAGFTDLEAFTRWFKKPAEQILERGRETLDDDALRTVHKLHDILRPYLLRRLKADVEKQMPGKYEHVIYCRLSKRQRYLYDGFMSRAQTKETLASGNTFSIMNALMQLRKVCNHPDLFETRQIVTSFAMPKSAVADFEIKELLVRRRLLREEPMAQVDLNLVNLLPGGNEPVSALDTIQKQRLGTLGAIRQLTSQQRGRVNWNLQFNGSTISGTLAHFENNSRRLRYDKLHQISYLTSLRSQRRPLYNHDLADRLRLGIKAPPHQQMPKARGRLSDWLTQKSPALGEMALTVPKRSEAMNPIVRKFGCITPKVMVPSMASMALGQKGVQMVEEATHSHPQDPFHEARMRLSIAFPDKRLLQYDCGKLQKLDSLLRQLQAGGHRALIFTQMTRVLDILEQFMNIHGHRYLRLDGATKLENRQVLTERFNNDDRILTFILSSRSGGIGINLTGADTVIFYDLDWNPAMDKQCQDRAHRIGQTRDVHIYRMVSEHTIEANILRKANQKRLLDHVVIQEGEFTTDYFNHATVKDIVGNESHDEAGAAADAAMDRVLGNRPGGQVFEAVEDQDDAKAAKEAEKEIATYDAADFNEKATSTPKTPIEAPQTPSESMPAPRKSQAGDDVETLTTMEAAQSGLAVPGAGMAEQEVEEVPSCDDYMIRFLDWELKDVPVQPPPDKKKSKKKGNESLGRKR